MAIWVVEFSNGVYEIRKIFATISLFFKVCEVTEVKSGRKKPCQFPFTHGGETFYHCTDKVGTEIFEKPWCSTKTVRKNRKNVHVVGGRFYGEDCPKNCLSSNKPVNFEDTATGNFINYTCP